MKNIVNFSKNVWRATSPRHWAATGTCALLVALMAGTLAIGGCATTEPGLTREQALYRVGTNVVASLDKAVPYLPVPVSSAAEVFLALASAGLAAWNTHQQVAIRKLKNGNGSGNGKAHAPPSTLSPPAAAPPPLSAA
jgi:hypothetical protein